jgi:prepilin-type N-terminal cleavage/methylation domain-containing protein
MRTLDTGKYRQAGFSLLEVLTVVVISSILMLTCIPLMSNVIATTKLRGSMTTVSGLLQNTRMVAVKENKTKTACHYNLTIAPYSLLYFVKDATACTSSTTLVDTDPQVELQAPISAMPAPTGVGAPPAISDSQLGLAADPLTSDPSFNSRGLPCAFSSGNCTAGAFIQYFKDNRISGSGGWAAVTISPAGRINRWFWNGSAWTN